MTGQRLERRANLVAVFIGGFAGTLVRAAVALAFPSPNDGWPWATFAVNLAGAYLLGHSLRWAAAGKLSSRRQLFVATGVAGSLTTFSNFVVEVVRLATEADPASAALYAGMSVVLGVALCAHGLGAGHDSGRHPQRRGLEHRA